LESVGKEFVRRPLARQDTPTINPIGHNWRPVR